jgi:hypothetical protein
MGAVLPLEFRVDGAENPENAGGGDKNAELCAAESTFLSFLRSRGEIVKRLPNDFRQCVPRPFLLRSDVCVAHRISTVEDRSSLENPLNT